MVGTSVASRIAGLVQSTKERLAAVSLDDVQDATSRGLNDGWARPAWIRDRTGRKGLVLVWQNPSAPVVEGVLPILSDFSAAIEQTDQLSSNGASNPKTKFVVTLKAPTGPTATTSKSPFTTRFAFVLDSLDQTTTEFVSELKRLQAKAEKNEYTATSKSHEWTKLYLPPRIMHPGPVEHSGHSTPTAKYGTPHFDTVSNAYARRVRPRSPARGKSRNSTLATQESSYSSSPKSTRSLRTLDSLDERSSSRHSQQAKDSIQHWIVDRIRTREAEFLDLEHIQIWCGTFNVNDKVARSDGSDLRSWISKGLGAELLVFSFQELDLTTEAMLRYTPYREEAWREAIDAAMATRRAEYEWLESKQLVGMLTIVYARKDIRKHISNISTASLATGFLGLMANKGVVGLRLRYKDTPITLLNSHLAAFSSQVQQRNAQFRDIVSQLKFPHVEGEARDAWTPNLNLNENVETLQGEGWDVSETAVLIWVGDLNYRLELPRKEVEHLIKNKAHERLAAYDQLHIQKQHGLAFSDFEEAPLDFPPTYKFDRGTNVYDSSEKQRVPSWTDRVLWLSLKRGEISATSYESHPDCSISDHKPVSAVLRIPVSVVDESKRNTVQQEVLGELSRFDSQSLPDVKLVPGPSVEFDEIEFDVPVTKTVELANVGQSLAPWSFVVKPDSDMLLPPWLSLFPTSGLIIPGERTTISFTIHVTAACAASHNFPLPSIVDQGLSDLFIVSIEKKDLFLAVSARGYRPSVFGSTLEQLTRLDEPIRSTSLENRQRIASVVESLKKPESARSEEEKKDAQLLALAGVPKAIHRLVDFLAEHALVTESLFSEEGDPDLIASGINFPLNALGFETSRPEVAEDKQHLRDAVTALERLESDIGSLSLEGTATPPTLPLDRKDTAARTMGMHSVAACLLALLASLAEPVIPYSLFARAIKCDKREEACALVQDLPPVHANVLLYILAFLRVLLSKTMDSSARTDRMHQLAIVFSFVLLREPPSFSYAGVEVASIPRRRKDFIYWLLEEV
ncbi:uncharacterized protein JCM15063_001101 [Sporobolomyces koalae]|uniref:uncharacterized protein n=1 Tax=Sporobolomyces koalae TaxID=500713 RepID=UPI003174F380